MPIFALSMLIAAATPAAAADPDPGAHASQRAPIRDAHAAFIQWIGAFEAGDYGMQWRLTHPRMRYWVRQSRWVRGMQRSHRRTGGLQRYVIDKAFEVAADQIPCTEQGHCFRKGVPYVLFMIRSQYGRQQPPQPEYVVMGMSARRWRFAGGTFPFRPLGETAVLLDEKDEERYRNMRLHR